MFCHNSPPRACLSRCRGAGTSSTQNSYTPPHLATAAFASSVPSTSFATSTIATAKPSPPPPPPPSLPPPTPPRERVLNYPRRCRHHHITLATVPPSPSTLFCRRRLHRRLPRPSPPPPAASQNRAATAVAVAAAAASPSPPPPSSTRLNFGFVVAFEVLGRRDRQRARAERALGLWLAPPLSHGTLNLKYRKSSPRTRAPLLRRCNRACVLWPPVWLPQARAARPKSREERQSSRVERADGPRTCHSPHCGAHRPNWHRLS